VDISVLTKINSAIQAAQQLMDNTKEKLVTMQQIETTKKALNEAMLKAEAMSIFFPEEVLKEAKKEYRLLNVEIKGIKEDPFVQRILEMKEQEAKEAAQALKDRLAVTKIQVQEVNDKADELRKAARVRHFAAMEKEWNLLSSGARLVGSSKGDILLFEDINWIVCSRVRKHHFNEHHKIITDVVMERLEYWLPKPAEVKIKVATVNKETGMPDEVSRLEKPASGFPEAWVNLCVNVVSLMRTLYKEGCDTPFEHESMARLVKLVPVEERGSSRKTQEQKERKRRSEGKPEPVLVAEGMIGNAFSAEQRAALESLKA
jgi:ribosomal protein L16/L10AE